MSDLHPDAGKRDESRCDYDMPKYRVKEIDLNGDTWLSVRETESGSATYRLRVSKALLSFASPYFRTLFGPHFLEGPAIHSGEDVKVLEEKSAAFTVLMKVLHMCSDVETPFRPIQAWQFVVVTDKYDCVKAVQLSLGSLMPVANNVDVQTHCVLVPAAYLLDSPRWITCYTQEVITDLRPCDLAAYGYLTLGSVPTAVYVVIQSRQSAILRELMKLIKSLPRAPFPITGPKCAASCSYLFAMNNALRAVGLDDVKDETVSATLKRVERLVLPGTSVFERQYGAHKYKCSHHGAIDPPKIDENFRKSLEAIRAHKTGLCIDCFKGNGWDKCLDECRNPTSTLARPCQ